MNTPGAWFEGLMSEMATNSIDAIHQCTFCAVNPLIRLIWLIWLITHEYIVHGRRSQLAPCRSVSLGCPMDTLGELDEGVWSGSVEGVDAGILQVFCRYEVRLSRRRVPLARRMEAQNR